MLLKISRRKSLLRRWATEESWSRTCEGNWCGKVRKGKADCRGRASIAGYVCMHQVVQVTVLERVRDGHMVWKRSHQELEDELHLDSVLGSGWRVSNVGFRRRLPKMYLLGVLWLCVADSQGSRGLLKHALSPSLWANVVQGGLSWSSRLVTCHSSKTPFYPFSGI